MASKSSGSFATRAVRAGQTHTAENEQSEPLFLTSSFRFASAEQAAARFANEEEGNIYSRFTNPTVRLFEQRLAALDEAEDCLATCSGMAAIMAAIMGICRSGSRLVASSQLFGATFNLLENYFAKFGVEVVIVPDSETDSWKKATGSKADLLFLESPSNPQLEVYDIAAIADIAHRAGALLMVDNCICTPALMKPLELGADIAMYSATKYLDGQGRVLGGALTGKSEILRERVFPFLRCGGPAMSPFNAWTLAKSLETLLIRIQAMSATADSLAHWLTEQPSVTCVNYPFSSGYRRLDLARRQQTAGGGLVSFSIAGGQPAAFRAINATQRFSITANFGDAKATICHPASTTHSRIDAQARAQAGIDDGMIRISAGLEDPADLREDLERILAAGQNAAAT